MHFATKNHVVQVHSQSIRVTYRLKPPVKCLFHLCYSGGVRCTLQTFSHAVTWLNFLGYQWHPGVTLSVCNYCVCPCLMCQYIRDSQIFTPLLVSVYFTIPTPNPFHQTHNHSEPSGAELAHSLQKSSCTGKYSQELCSLGAPSSSLVRLQ